MEPDRPAPDLLAGPDASRGPGAPGATAEASGPGAAEATAAEAPEPAAVEALADRQRRASRRMRQTVRDMLLSMLVVGAVAVLIAQPWRQTSAEQPLRVVDWAPVAAGFEQSVDWPVLTPHGLPATWQSTSARIEPTVDGRTALHIGWITAGRQYAALEQSDTADVRYVHDTTGGGVPTGTPYDAGGRSWARLETPDGATRSLLLAVPDGAGRNPVTYVVTGSAQWPELEQLAASLR